MNWIREFTFFKELVIRFYDDFCYVFSNLNISLDYVKYLIIEYTEY